MRAAWKVFDLTRNARSKGTRIRWKTGVSSDGFEHFVFVSDDTRLLFWTYDHGKPVTRESERSRRPRGRLERAEYEFNRDGGKDKIVKVWDWRKIVEFFSEERLKREEKPSKKDMVIMSHCTKAKFSRELVPHDENVFASASDDGCLNVWDLSRKKGTNSRTKKQPRQQTATTNLILTAPLLVPKTTAAKV